MEHPHIVIGKVALHENRDWVKIDQIRRNGKNFVRPHFCLSEEKLRELTLISCSRSIDFLDEEKTGCNALRRLKRMITGQCEDGSVLRDLALMVANPQDVAFGIYSKIFSSRYISRRAVPLQFVRRVRSEQIPKPKSRVSLSERRDSLGLNQIRLDWRMNGAERRSMRLVPQFLV